MKSAHPALALVYSLAAVFLILPGCGSVSPPRLSVGQAWMTDETVDGAKGAFELIAENPNREVLLLRDVLYTVTADGTKVFEGRRAAGATLSSYGGQTLTIPFVATEGGALRPGAVIRVTGDLEYSDTDAFSKTLMDAGLSDPSKSFQGEATMVERR